MRAEARRARAGHLTLDMALVGATVLLGAVTFAIAQVPERATLGANLAGQMVISTMMTVASWLLATLLWLRFRELRATSLPYQAAAFATLGLINAYFLIVAIQDASLPSSGHAAPAAILAYSVGRMACGILLVAGGIAALRRADVSYPGTRGLYLVGPAIVVILAGVGAVAPDIWHSASPPALAFAAPHAVPAALVVHLPIALVFLVGSLVYREVYAREPQAANGALSLGLLVAAFAQIHAAIEPGTHSARITTDEILRLTMYAFLLAGIAIQTGADVRRIVRADRDLERLRQIELERAALEDRERLAREIHDGIAQDLWLTKLAFGQLRTALPAGGGLERLADDVDTALQTAVATTRQAISWMQSAAVSASAFGEALGQLAEEFTDRFGLRVDVTADEAPPLEPSVQVELLRITQEALRNTLKHANVARATVSLSVTARWLQLVIEDHGRGFEMDQVPIGSFGLMTMSRRAEVIGARLEVISRPGAGTRVSVRLALHAPRAVAVDGARNGSAQPVRTDAPNVAGTT